MQAKHITSLLVTEPDSDILLGVFTYARFIASWGCLSFCYAFIRIKMNTMIETCYGAVSKQIMQKAEKSIADLRCCDGVMSDGLIYMGNER